MAFYDPEEACVEMRLRSRREQRVSVPGAELEVALAEGEEIRTEISSKFTPERIRSELEAADLELIRLFTDDEELFSLALGAPAG